MFSKTRVVSFVSLSVLCSACQQKEIPRDFKLELPELVSSPDPVTLSVRVTNNDGVKATSQDEYDYVLNPPTLATISKRGVLSCRGSGDGTVSLTLGANTRKADLHCRLVEKVDASDVGRVDISRGAFKPKVRVLGKGGAELDGVPLVLSSKNSGVLLASGSELVPKSVGSATISARAGQVTQEFKVDVVRKLTPEALPIEQNRKIHFSLEAGKYELRVQLPTEKTLSAEWRGAPYCNYSGVNKEHVSTCVLRTKGGVVFDNPGYLINGSTDVSVEGVTISEVP
ncbi:MAG: hypothetical protein QM756_03165 [Polyangiaceae bacterium]